jgi:uncharacterized protein
MSDNPAPAPKDEKLSETARGFWESMGMWGPLTILLTIGFIIAYFFFVPPPPPKKFIIATGGTSGAYYAFANKYKEILKRDGFELEVLSTKGSIENLKLLNEGKVTMAFVQGGTATAEDAKLISSLGSLYYEPLWVFHRGAKSFQYLKQLKDKRLAIGSPGSGTRAVAQQLLKKNGVPFDPKLHLPLSGTEAAVALKAGQVDAVFLVASGRSKTVLDLLESKNIHLMNFIRHQAYERHFPFLSAVNLSEGTCNIERNVPARDTNLLAPTATLAIRKDAHKALTPLILRAVTEVHYPGDLFEKAGDFPSVKHLDLPISVAAKTYITSGPNVLLRYLPFWLALAMDRLKIMLVPLFTLLLPLVKVAPPIYRWRIRSKIFRWYRTLREIDQEIMNDDKLKNPGLYHRRLQNLEEELDKVSVPLSYMEEFYNLRVHIAVVDKFIDQRQQILINKGEDGE